MDNRPIGFFDSGLGGLTSVSALKEEMPDEKVIYFGDTARTPYGSKSPETIRKFATQIVDYLVKNDVKLIVIACNTVTAMALDGLREKYPDIPIVGVIEPTARKICEEGIEKVGIIGTPATIKSGIYEKTILEINPSVETVSLACPLFVPLIEEGVANTKLMDEAIRMHLDDFMNENGLKDLLLGCTHYPMISENIKKIYPGVRLYDSSREVIKDVRNILVNADALAGPNDLEDRYYASDMSDNFVRMVDILLGVKANELKVAQIDKD